MKERWFNYRPLCLIFGFLILGSVFAFFVPKYTFLGIIFMLGVLIVLLLITIFKKKPKYILIPAVSFVIGISLFYLAVFNFNKTIDYTPTIIQARIYNISREVDGMISVEADSCKFNNKKINDNIKIYIYDNDGIFKNIQVGNVIKFKPYKFYKSELVSGKTPSAYLFTNDLKYTASALIDDVEFVKVKKTISEKVKEKIKNNLSYGLTNENTEIPFSALFGDKDLLADKQYSVYKLSGVAHLLAVSGLHVGIIVAFLSKLFKKFKVKKWWTFSIIAIFLFMYMHVCGYAVSILRASIMSLILLLSTLLGKEYDPANSISIAGIFIFLINPLCVFDVAFLLSFSCVIGITMLYSPIEKALKKTQIPDKLIKSVATSLSTTIAIVIIMAYYFRTLNIISILANVILIPIFAFAFTILFVISILSILVPYLTYLLFPLNYIFEFINLVATILGNLAISNFNTIEFNYIAIILYLILLIFVGRFCTAKHQYKLITALPMVALLFYCLL